MKAVLKEDIIVNLSDCGDIEIGNIPQDVGLERLRWNGEKIVDLNDLAEIWVRKLSDSFELHCIEVKDSQLVKMTYADRKILMSDDGTIRLKTQEEIDAERIVLLKKIAKDRLENKLGYYIDMELAQLAFICALIVYSRQQPAQLAAFFDELIPDIINAFPLSRWESLLKKFAKDLKQFITDYYSEIDSA